MSYDFGPKPDTLLSGQADGVATPVVNPFDYALHIAQAGRAKAGERPYNVYDPADRRDLAADMAAIILNEPITRPVQQAREIPSVEDEPTRGFDLRKRLTQISDAAKRARLHAYGSELALDDIAHMDEVVRMKPALETPARRAEPDPVLSRRGFLGGLAATSIAVAVSRGKEWEVSGLFDRASGGETTSTLEDRPMGAWVPEEIQQWRAMVHDVIEKPELSEGNPNTLPDTSAALAIMLVMSGGDPSKHTDDGRVGLFGLPEGIVGLYAPHISELKDREAVNLADPYINTLLAATHLDNLRRITASQTGEAFINATEPDKWSQILQNYDPGNADRNQALVAVVPHLIDQWQDEVSPAYDNWQASLEQLTGGGEN